MELALIEPLLEPGLTQLCVLQVRSLLKRAHLGSILFYFQLTLGFNSKSNSRKQLLPPRISAPIPPHISAHIPSPIPPHIPTPISPQILLALSPPAKAGGSGWCLGLMARADGSPFFHFQLHMRTEGRMRRQLLCKWSSFVGGFFFYLRREVVSEESFTEKVRH